jgi:pimeloyl-ACP methyl ester carboxylesterase
MATFVLIHGAGDVAWSWHLVAAELRAKGHDVVAPDLPCEDDAAGLDEYANTVIEHLGDRRDPVVVGHSFGAFTATLVAGRVPVSMLVLLAGMVPAVGESPGDWWANTGYSAAVAEARRAGDPVGDDDPYVSFYHDVPRELSEEAMSRGRDQSETPSRSPWPLDALPDVPTRYVLCTEDRFFPPEFLRRVVAARLRIVPDQIAGSHCVPLSRPKELADLLAGYAAGA